MKHKPSKQTWQEFEIGVIGLICMALFLFMWNSWTNLGKNNVGHLTKAYSMEIPEPLTFAPDLPEVDIALKPADYKTLRLQEMANAWKGTVLEKHTVPLLAMLLVEDGTITAERRHDCGNIYSKRLGRYLKGCFAMGIMGHNIASRGTPMVAQDHGKPWKLYDYDYAMTDFEKDYPAFSTDWRIQFAEYTRRMTDCLQVNSIDSCIQSWNSREAGRLDKVARLKPFVHDAIF